MQCRAIFRVVDGFARKHRVDAGAQLARVRECEQGIERGPVDALPAEVEQESAEFAREIPEPGGVLGKQGLHRRPGEPLRVGREGLLSQGW